MSIATEISRLQTAKADIKTAIEAKGVIVPSNATLDTYDTYVSQISGGGGINYLEQYAKGGLTGAITSAQLGTNMSSHMIDNLLASQNSITSVDLTGTGAIRIASSFCRYCSNLTSVTIPSTVAEISTYFLAGSSIPSVTIPSTVTSVGQNTFDNCTSLTQLIYNAHTANLPQYLCSLNTNLALVDLNSSVASIGRYCFRLSSASTNLLEVVLRKTDGIVTLPNAIGNTGTNAAFRYRRNIKIYVPSALIASYQADANWAAGITAGYLTIVALEGSQYE